MAHFLLQLDPTLPVSQPFRMTQDTLYVRSENDIMRLIFSSLSRPEYSQIFARDFIHPANSATLVSKVTNRNKDVISTFYNIGKHVCIETNFCIDLHTAETFNLPTCMLAFNSRTPVINPVNYKIFSTEFYAQSIALATYSAWILSDPRVDPSERPNFLNEVHDLFNAMYNMTMSLCYEIGSFFSDLTLYQAHYVFTRLMRTNGILSQHRHEYNIIPPEFARCTGPIRFTRNISDYFTSVADGGYILDSVVFLISDNLTSDNYELARYTRSLIRDGINVTIDENDGDNNDGGDDL